MGRIELFNLCLCPVISYGPYHHNGSGGEDK